MEPLFLFWYVRSRSCISAGSLVMFLVNFCIFLSSKFVCKNYPAPWRKNKEKSESFRILKNVTGESTGCLSIIYTATDNDVANNKYLAHKLTWINHLNEILAPNLQLDLLNVLLTDCSLLILDICRFSRAKFSENLSKSFSAIEENIFASINNKQH